MGCSASVNVPEEGAKAPRTKLPGSSDAFVEREWPFGKHDAVVKDAIAKLATDDLDKKGCRQLLIRFLLLNPDDDGFIYPSMMSSSRPSTVDSMSSNELESIRPEAVDVPTGKDTVLERSSDGVLRLPHNAWNARLDQSGVLARLLVASPMCQRTGYVDFPSFVQTVMSWRQLGLLGRHYKVFEMFDSKMSGEIEMEDAIELCRLLAPQLSEQLLVDAADSMILDAGMYAMLAEGKHRDAHGAGDSISFDEYFDWMIGRIYKPKFGFESSMVKLDLERPAEYDAWVFDCRKKDTRSARGSGMSSALSDVSGAPYARSSVGSASRSQMSIGSHKGRELAVPGTPESQRRSQMAESSLGSSGGGGGDNDNRNSALPVVDPETRLEPKAKAARLRGRAKYTSAESKKALSPYSSLKVEPGSGKDKSGGDVAKKRGLGGNSPAIPEALGDEADASSISSVIDDREVESISDELLNMVQAPIGAI